jgi:hypothetical protein
MAHIYRRYNRLGDFIHVMQVKITRHIDLLLFTWSGILATPTAAIGLGYENLQKKSGLRYAFRSKSGVRLNAGPYK